MKKQTVTFKMISLLLASSIAFASCSSTTMIQSIPSDAKVYIDGQPVGKTPYAHTDTKIVGTTTMMQIKKEGYAPLYASFSRNEQADVGAIIGGVFVLVPFLWTMKYNPVHLYELEPVLSDGQSIKTNQTQKKNTASKADRLRDLKKLLDDKVITQKEFEIEKAKILSEDDK